MNLSEFKAFVDGIEHAFKDEAPSPEQWQLIKDKLHQINQEPKIGFREHDTGRTVEEVIRGVRPYTWPSYREAPTYGIIKADA